MPGGNLNKFFLSIVFPSILAIGLFIVSIYVVIIPSFESNIMDEKKVMISELTNTAWSLLEEFDQEYQAGKLSEAEAQNLAASRIKQIRYGRENKDYFWIIDRHPTMIMHPYTSELIGSDLTDYQDPNGKKLFVEANDLVGKNGSGFIEYMWQWKDDSTRIVPKLSYVKGYEPWGWIIGTGIYLEDVREEIRQLRNNLLRISFSITILITVILSFVIRQSLRIENKRKVAESNLLLSRQKYKSLVEASTEGTLMLLNENIIFSNVKFNALIGFDAEKVLSLKFEDIFNADWSAVLDSISDSKKTLSLETQIKCHDGVEKDVVLSISEIKYGRDISHIIVIKEVTHQKMVEKETTHLAQELQTSLLLMNQPIKHLINDLLKCPIDTTVHDASALMVRKKSDVLFVHQDNEIIGVINDSDLKKRVLAENLETSRHVMEIMTSPVISINENALMYEAILLLNDKKISHLAIKGDNGPIIGVISHEDITSLQLNSVSYLIKEIEVTQDIDQLVRIHNRIPVLVNALVESGDKTQNITRIITSVSDAILRQIISLAIEDLGKPPCEFAFMVMGSEGRMEQTLLTDQDNAIVFSDLNGVNKENAYSYFNELGKKVCTDLNTVGYKFCDGDIMAQNPKWTQPISVWQSYFTEWINSSEPQNILDACIFFDFRFIYGEKSLIDKLRNHVNQVVDNKSVFFYHLAQSVIKYKAPVSLFGKIIDKHQTGDEVNLDVKKVLLPIAGFIRLYALQHKIEQTNSLERIKLLYEQKIISKTIYDELVLSYNYLMQLRFRFQAQNIIQNRPPDNSIDINNLTHIEVSTIKKIFSEIGNLQTKLNFDFKGSM